MSATKSTTMFSLGAFKTWCNITANATKSISSLTSAALVATAVSTAHGLFTGQAVTIAGATQAGYNGLFTVTVVDANTFTYALASTQTSPATGTITFTPDDARLVEICDAASAEIERQTSRYFVKRSGILTTFSGDNKPAHALDYRPIISIDTFSIDGTSINGTPYTVASPPSSSDYYVDPDQAVIEFTSTPQTGVIWGASGTFSWGIRNVIVNYTAGYDVQDGPLLPSDVYRAGLDLAKAIYDELKTGAIAASRLNFGPAGIFLKPALIPNSVQRVINSWKDVRFA